MCLESWASKRPSPSSGARWWCMQQTIWVKAHSLTIGMDCAVIGYENKIHTYNPWEYLHRCSDQRKSWRDCGAERFNFKWIFPLPSFFLFFSLWREKPTLLPEMNYRPIAFRGNNNINYFILCWLYQLLLEQVGFLIGFFVLLHNHMYNYGPRHDNIFCKKHLYYIYIENLEYLLFFDSYNIS